MNDYRPALSMKTLFVRDFRWVLGAAVALLLSSCASVGQHQKSTQAAGGNYLIYGESSSPSQTQSEDPKVEAASADLRSAHGVDDLLEEGRGDFYEVNYFDRNASYGNEDAWTVIAQGLSMEGKTSDRDYKRALNLYRNNQAFIDRISARAAPFLFYIVELAKAWDMPMEVVLLGFIESDMDPFALSYAGALGIWQFMPDTANLMGIPNNWYYAGRRDVPYSTAAAFQYLRQLHETFDDWELAMAAYNSGPGHVAYAVSRNKARRRDTDFWSLSLPAQTNFYVPKILALSEILRHPDQYGVTLPHIPYAPSIAVFHVNHQIQFRDLSDKLGVKLSDLMLLNSGYSQSTSAPEGNTFIVVPYDKRPEATAYLQDQEAKVASRDLYTLYLAKADESASEVSENTGNTLEQLTTLNDPVQLIDKKERLLTINVPYSLLPKMQSIYADRVTSGDFLQKRRSDRVVYKVKNGDSLWTVSRKFNISVKDLHNWNDGLASKLIHKGDRLYVSAPKNITVMPVPNAQISAEEDTDSFRVINYRLKRMEGWEEIAQRLHVNSQELRDWNQDVRLARGLIHLRVDTKRIFQLPSAKQFGASMQQ